MKKPIRIVYFYTVVVHYVVGVLKALKALDDNIEITLVFYDTKTPEGSNYLFPSIDGVNLLARSTLNKKSLYELLVENKPDILYISGWVDKEYIGAAKKYKFQNKSVKVINGIDDQWFGTLRQYVGTIYFKLFYKKLFDYFWVSGKPQFSYAQRFGYNNENIINNLLSPNAEIFDSPCRFSKRFVFLGRFVEVKGIDLLIEAYNMLEEKLREEWPLVFIGDGPLRDYIESKKEPQTKILPFLQDGPLKAEIQKGGVLCLPSRFEPWGLVVNELALSGFPLMLSTACGAATEFLIPGYNGFLFKKGDVNSLYRALMRFTQLKDEELKEFGQNSFELGKRINSKIGAASLLSVMYD